MAERAAYLCGQVDPPTRVTCATWSDCGWTGRGRRGSNPPRTSSSAWRTGAAAWDTALLAEVVQWCRSAGRRRIVLNPSEMSLKPYRALGFRPADDLMRLDL